MPKTDWVKTWHDPQLDVRLLQAHFVQHAYARHSHDYYVIGIIDSGRQSFLHEGRRYYTPPGGVILINPGAVHTGEQAGAGGYAMRCLYPTVAQMQAAALDVAEHPAALPEFTSVRVDDPWAHAAIAALHQALSQDTSPLERESRLRWTLAQLLSRYGTVRPRETRPRGERQAVRQARRYIDEHFAEGVRLAELAEHVGLSPYYLLRAFRDEVGLPPHAYLENVRIRRAEQLIRAGRPLAEIALEMGFSSQSHFTRSFRRILGVTPGQYARQRNT